MIRESELLHEEVFRPRLAPLLAVGWYLVGAYATFDLVRRGDGSTIAVGLAVVALVSVVVYAIGTRPAVIANDRGVLLRNVLRDVYVPWHRVERIGARWSLTVETSDAVYGSWALSAGNPTRERQRGRRVFGVGPEVGEDNVPADETSGMVSARLERRRERGARLEPEGDVEVRTAWPVAAGVAVTCLALALALLLR